MKCKRCNRLHMLKHDYCDGCKPYVRIEELEAKLAEMCAERDEARAKLEENNRLTKRWDKYLGKAWHHDFCPLYSGSTHGGCTCGYSDVMEGGVMSWVFVADDGEQVHYDVPPQVAELEAKLERLRILIQVTADELECSEGRIEWAQNLRKQAALEGEQDG